MSRHAGVTAGSPSSARPNLSLLGAPEWCLHVSYFYAESVPFLSPGSRSAPWVRGAAFPSPNPARVVQGGVGGSGLYNPFRVDAGGAPWPTQRALRDAGLGYTTLSGLEALRVLANPGCAADGEPGLNEFNAFGVKAKPRQIAGIG